MKICYEKGRELSSVFFKDFEHLYCPHCNAQPKVDFGFRSKKCPVCGGIIWYAKAGTRKGWFEVPDLPLRVKDILIVALLVAVIIFFCLHKQQMTREWLIMI
jgi:hypothetical protein